MKFLFPLQRKQILIGFVTLLAITVTIVYFTGIDLLPRQAPEQPSLADSYDPPTKKERNAGRADYFHRMLKDPRTGRIPPNVRSRELHHVQNLPTRSARKMKGNAEELNWAEVGPNNVGGRTRALGIDLSDSNVILAGGASGGIWKTTDGGDSWQLKTDPKHHQSVTSLDQDPRSGERDTWYFVTGEFFSGSSSDRGFRARYYGDGVYKSTDNGETWQQMTGTGDNDDSFNSPFDFMSRVRVNPATGSVFIASNGYGIYRSTDGETFENRALLGGPGHHRFADLDIADDGTIAAVLSGWDAGASSNNPGVFVSTDDGDNWTEVTPSGWPSDADNSYERSVIEIAPSNTDLAYVFTYTGFGEGNNEDVLLYRVNLSTGESTNLSSNLPDYGGSSGFVVTQFGYNMELAVHPNDEDFVLLGGRNLYRSFDGFRTPLDDSNQKNRHWIGGYTRSNNGFSSYSNHHPDQHVVAFDPNEPSITWSAHDGGLSKTDDITTEPVSWIDKNNGYNVTQFYSVALPDTAGDKRIMGGTQDNGNPFFRYGTTDGSTNSTDIAGGDGGYGFFTPDYAFQSLQNGLVIRFGTWPVGGNINNRNWAYVHPGNASNQLFIHPYSVNPNDQTIMYYPSGTDLWRNTAVDNISNTDSDGSTLGWENPLTWQNIAPHDGYNITAITVSDTLPEHRLYLGASARQDQNTLTDEHPRIYRIDDTHNQTNTPRDITIDTSMTTEGAYVHDIAVNPINADEIVVVLSNYNIESAFHSDDGGNTWTAIEGNLASDRNVMGPSVRSASILPTSEGPIYALGTSAGLYTTMRLDTSSIEWVLEAPNSLGYSIIEHLDQRTADRLIAAGTHGRGIFLGSSSDSSAIDPPDDDPEPSDSTDEKPQQFKLGNYPNPFNSSTTISYSIPHKSDVTLRIYGLNGKKIRDVILQVEKEPGEYEEAINLGDLSSGIYLYQLLATPLTSEGSHYSKTKKMTFIK